MCITVLSTCTTCMYSACRGQERALDPPLTGVSDGCEPLYGWWEMNPGLLKYWTASPVPPILLVMNILSCLLFLQFCSALLLLSLFISCAQPSCLYPAISTTGESEVTGPCPVLTCRNADPQRERHFSFSSLFSAPIGHREFGMQSKNDDWIHSRFSLPIKIES